MNARSTYESGLFRPILGPTRRSRTQLEFRLSQDLGLEKQKLVESNRGGFFCDRIYDQTVTAGACFCVFFRATASSKSLKTLVFNICKCSVKVAL